MTLITFTDAAAAHIQAMVAKQPNSKGFRLAIKKTGCSGYSYSPEIITEVNENDVHFVAQQGLQVYVDSNCQALVKNVIVDYVADTVGLKQKRLVFINPNEKDRCGCGESFTIE